MRKRCPDCGAVMDELETYFECPDCGYLQVKPEYRSYSGRVPPGCAACGAGRNECRCILFSFEGR